MSRKTLIGFLLALFLPLFLSGCSGPFAQYHAINATFDVKMTDPDIRHLTNVTSRIEVIADGEFTPGNYVINKKTISIDPGTQFRLHLVMPIKDPAVIHTADATGELSTSQQYRINGIGVPQTIQLSSGQVSGEVDLVRSLGAVFISCLQKGSSDTDVHQMLESLHIDDAVFDLRPDSKLELDRQTIHVGPDSTISLKNITVAHDLSYEGTCILHLNLLKGNEWRGQRAHVEFDEGKADLVLKAEKSADRVTLSLIKQQAKSNKINIAHCIYRFGKDHRAHAESRNTQLTPKELKMVFIKNAEHPQIHVVSAMQMEHGLLDLKTDIQETIAVFPEGIPATLQVDEDSSGKVTTQFDTTDLATAESIKIAIAKLTTTLTIWLTDAVVGPVSLDRSGAMQFNLEHGTAHLKQLDWSGNKSKFTLVTSGGSAITIPTGMLLEKADVSARTRMKLPLDIKLGTATIKGARGDTVLTNLDGQLSIDVDKEVQIGGDLGFHLPNSPMLGGEPVDIDARGLNLSVANGSAFLELKKCTVQVPQGSIQDAINDKVPKFLSLNLNKVVSDKEKWRYRHAIAGKATLRNLQLDNMKPLPPDTVKFDALGDVELVGTVEKLIDQEDHSLPEEWVTCPWKLTGHMDCSGAVKYHFVSEGAKAHNVIEYNLALEVPIPVDVKLDWSKVAPGPIGYLERRVILHHLKRIKLPINYSGQVPLFTENNTLTRNFKISNLVAKHTRDETQLDFTASARF